MFDTAKESIGGSATSLEIYGKMEEVFIKMDSEENVSLLTYLYVPTKNKAFESYSNLRLPIRYGFSLIFFPYLTTT
jgi:hypothetical protein